MARVLNFMVVHQGDCVIHPMTMTQAIQRWSKWVYDGHRLNHVFLINPNCLQEMVVEPHENFPHNPGKVKWRRIQKKPAPEQR
jgi:hypothetical protein